jgi:rod shape-determining protein MreC
VERRVDSAFARIVCTPLGLVSGASHVMVLKALAVPTGPRPEASAPTPATRPGGRR